MLRLMPNLPCLVQEGALLFSRGSRATPEDAALLRSLLQRCGLVEEGPEAWIDVHTGLSGSGVAFVSDGGGAQAGGRYNITSLSGHCCLTHSWRSLQVYLFAEALADGAVKMGMPSSLAHSIAAQTIVVSSAAPSILGALFLYFHQFCCMDRTQGCLNQPPPPRAGRRQVVT